MREILHEICGKVKVVFDAMDKARDKAYAMHREAIKYCSLSIKYSHRFDFTNAEKYQEQAQKTIKDIKKFLKPHPRVYYAGFFEDAQKEYAEACITLSLIKDLQIPDPDSIGVEYAPYLNGLGEAASEMRRHILDLIRKENIAKAEKYLEIIDEVYYALAVMDYPDIITRGLRRTNDLVRSIAEKTRGDLTTALMQKNLIQNMKQTMQDCITLGASKD
jgi:translin